MPELPEVETVRRTLEPLLVGRRVARVDLRRGDIVEGDGSAAALLEGATIEAIRRHGKQLAIIADHGGRRSSAAPSVGRVLVVHLGMTGQLVHHAVCPDLQSTTHVHALWTMERGAAMRSEPAGVLVFRDPRRFGGLWPLSLDALGARWSELGPDALAATGEGLGERGGESARAVKGVLLDQSVIAGVGNIYADEALFRAGIRPTRRARRVRREEWDALAAAIGGVMRAALEAGGSTVRDYVGGTGERGRAQLGHAVYGRMGEPCVGCGTTLKGGIVAQRTTVWCPRCQR